MNETARFFLGYGAFFGGLIGWWTRGRRERRARVPDVIMPLLELIEHEVARRQTHEQEADLARRARLAYDTAYDEKHPEEWA